MSAVSVIALIVVAAMLSGLTVAWWHGRQHLFSVLFVAAVVTLAAAMTIGRLNEEQKPVTAGRAPAPIAASAGGSTPSDVADLSAGAP